MKEIRAGWGDLTGSFFVFIKEFVRQPPHQIKLTEDLEPLLADLREIRDTYSGTESLEAELKTLDEQMNLEVDTVQELISQNARVARNQNEYAVEYDAMVTKFEVTKAKRDKIAAEIRVKGIRQREFERFILELEKLPDVVTEFDEALWGSLVEKVTVYGKDDIRFLLPCGTEIKT